MVQDDAFKKYVTKAKSLLEGFNLGASELSTVVNDDTLFTRIEPYVMPWANFYELSFNQITVVLFGLLGIADELEKIQGTRPKPIEMIEYLEKLSEDFDDSDILPEGHELDDDEKKYLTALCTILFAHKHNVEAIKQRNRPISTMIQQIKDKVDNYQKIVFEVVTIDRSAIANPTIAREISKAQMRQDESFMNLLSKAITRTKPARYKEQHDTLRFMMQALSEYLQKDTPTSLEVDELCQSLNLFEANEDPFSALDKHRQKRKKDIRK